MRCTEIQYFRVHKEIKMAAIAFKLPVYGAAVKSEDLNHLLSGSALFFQCAQDISIM